MCLKPGRLGDGLPGKLLGTPPQTPHIAASLLHLKGFHKDAGSEACYAAARPGSYNDHIIISGEGPKLDLVPPVGPMQCQCLGVDVGHQHLETAESLRTRPTAQLEMSNSSKVSFTCDASCSYVNSELLEPRLKTGRHHTMMQLAKLSSRASFH